MAQIGLVLPTRDWEGWNPLRTSVTPKTSELPIAQPALGSLSLSPLPQLLIPHQTVVRSHANDLHKLPDSVKSVLGLVRKRIIPLPALLSLPQLACRAVIVVRSGRETISPLLSTPLFILRNPTSSQRTSDCIRQDTRPLIHLRAPIPTILYIPSIAVWALGKSVASPGPSSIKLSLKRCSHPQNQALNK